MYDFNSDLNSSGKDLEHKAKTVTVDGVEKFLRLNKLDKYAKLFRDNDIDGEVLLALGKEELCDLGITNAFHQTKIITKFKSYIKELA